MPTKECSTCGNEIPLSSARCKYCGAQQHGAIRQKSTAGRRVYTVNMESGLPSIEEGIKRLEDGLLRAGHSGARVVRIIHGYGSSGTGGKLRDACRTFLKQAKAARRIKTFMPGEEYSGGTDRGLVNRYPELRQGERSDSGNPGITLVLL